MIENSKSLTSYNLFHWIEIELGSNSKGDTKVYKITCHGPICRDLSLQVKISRGDADLYGKEDEPPQIYESNCASCTCKSRGSDLVDKCLVTTEGKFKLNVEFL